MEKELTGLENFALLKQKLESVTPDAEKCFIKENQSASARVRKTLQEVKKLCGAIRKQTLQVKNK